MFLEKRMRYIRLYRLTLKPRHVAAAQLPLVAPDGKRSALAALRHYLKQGKAAITTANDEIIELVSINHDAANGRIVLLFHKGSPNAADPTYRRKTKGTISVRKGQRERDEEQSVSSHMIIKTASSAKGVHNVVLEEIPGLSMGVLQPIIGRALRDYNYPYQDSDGEDKTTYCVVGLQGVKSHSVEEALKTGQARLITLSRAPQADFVDEDKFIPQPETLKIKLKTGISGASWHKAITDLFTKAGHAGWSDFYVNLDLGDSRSREVHVSRDQDAKEVLYIRSEKVFLQKDLDVCEASIREDFIKEAVSKAKFG